MRLFEIISQEEIDNALFSAVLSFGGITWKDYVFNEWLNKTKRKYLKCINTPRSSSAIYRAVPRRLS